MALIVFDLSILFNKKKWGGIGEIFLKISANYQGEKMARKCLVCGHPERVEIDRSMVEGLPYREIERRFRVDKSSLSRHLKHHLAEALQTARKAEDALKGESLWEQIEWLKAEALRISVKAEQAEDYRTALAGIREMTRIVELMAKLRGDLSDQQVNIILSPQWVQLRSTIVSALEEFPGARAKLAEVLGNAG